MTIICETQRLILREFTENDAEAFMRLTSDPLITRYTGDRGSVTVDEARRDLCTRPIADYRRYGFGRWAVVLKSGGEPIGFAGLKYLDDLKAVDIGYRLLPSYWGMGLATESSLPAIAYGFDTLGLDRIIGLVDPENVASAKVLQKLGLTYVGMTEYKSNTVAQYAIDRSDFARTI
jgi:RimJ/RimL family protein N-acetyltransferase